MELKLKTEQVEHYEALARTPFFFETTQEDIVPDYCADVARIVDTTGCVLVHSKELTPDGRVEVNGVLKVTVLFVPDTGGEAAALHLSIPFHHSCEGKDYPQCSHYSVQGRLAGIDTRMLNPRKLLTRAEIVLEVSAYRPKTMILSVAAEDEEACGLQLLRDSAETSVITEVLEREFTYAEEMTLSASRRGIQEILDTRTGIYSAETKIIGSRLVLKGIIRGEILYKDTAGELGTLSQEYLFSQIAETSVPEDRGEARASFTLTGFEYLIGSEEGGDDGHTVTMSLHLHADIQVMESRKLEFLADMYSTSKEVTLERQTLHLAEDLRVQTRKQAMREILETGAAVREVVCAAVNCGTCTCFAGEDGVSAEAPITIKCLYLDENGALLLAEKEVRIKGESEMPAGKTTLYLQCPGEVTAAPSPEGIETRFSLEFVMDSGSFIQKPCVVSAQAEEIPLTGERKPSLVLRKFDREMGLWDIAKLYRTTGKDILAANQLEGEEEITPDRLLLIPNHR